MNRLVAAIMRLAHLFVGRHTGRVVVQYMGPVNVQVGVLPDAIGQTRFGEIGYKRRKARTYLNRVPCFW